MERDKGSSLGMYEYNLISGAWVELNRRNAISWVQWMKVRWEWTWVDGTWHALEKMVWKNKVCGPKDTCMRVNLGRDVAWTRKVGMKNKVCGPEGPWYEMAWAELMLRHLANLIFHNDFSSECHVPSTHIHSPSAHKPYFSYYFFERMPRPVDPGSFSCKHPSKYPSAHKPYFFIPFFRAHATSRRPRSTLMQVSFGPQT